MAAENKVIGFDLKLVPRIKLDFEAIGLPGRVFDSRTVCISLQLFSVSGGNFGVDVRLSEKDIYFKFDSLTKGLFDARVSSGKKSQVIGRGTIFFRNYDFVLELEHLYNKDDATDQKLRKVREYLKEKLSAVKMNLHGHRVDLRAFSSVTEDADEMMALAGRSNGEYPPAFVVKRLPCLWFPDDAYPFPLSKKRVAIFFETWGAIKDLDATENPVDANYCTVTIQYARYEDCYKALKYLCSASLKRVMWDSPSTPHCADYEIMWKDCFTPVSQPEKLSDNEQKNELTLQSLKQEMALLQEKLKKLEANYSGSPSKDNEDTSELHAPKDQMAARV